MKIFPQGKLMETEIKRRSSNSAKTTGQYWVFSLLPPGCGLLLIGIAPIFISKYWMFLTSMLFAYVIAILGLKVLYGDCGQLSLAQASFMAIGAYGAAIASTKLRLTLPYELLFVIVVCVCVAIILALSALRVSGLRFALVTLAFGGIIQRFLREARSLTGGEQGLFVPSPFLGSLDTKSPIFLYFTSALLACLATLIAWHLPKTRTGRAMCAVRESEMAAVSVGISLMRTKLTAFVLSSVFGGVSGLLVAHVSRSISPTTFGLFPSIYLIVALIVGGRRSAFGSWVGAAYLVAIPALFTALNLSELYAITSGAILLTVVMLYPSGISGLLQKFGTRLSVRLGSVSHEQI